MSVDTGEVAGLVSDMTDAPRCLSFMRRLIGSESRTNREDGVRPGAARLKHPLTFSFEIREGRFTSSRARESSSGSVQDRRTRIAARETERGSASPDSKPDIRSYERGPVIALVTTGRNQAHGPAQWQNPSLFVARGPASVSTRSNIQALAPKVEVASLLHFTATAALQIPSLG